MELAGLEVALGVIEWVVSGCEGLHITVDFINTVPPVPSFYLWTGSEMEYFCVNREVDWIDRKYLEETGWVSDC